MLVNVKVTEGDRTRVQAYEGVCIARSGGGLNENFTVRKISYGEGVERVFPLYAPMIDSIKVVRRGKVRRAKLYYLRGRARQVGPHRRVAGPSRRQCRRRQGSRGVIAPSIADTIKGRLRPAFFMRCRAHSLHCGFSLELLYRSHETRSNQAFAGCPRALRAARSRSPAGTLFRPHDGVDPGRSLIVSLARIARAIPAPIRSSQSRLRTNETAHALRQDLGRPSGRRSSRTAPACSISTGIWCMR